MTKSFKEIYDADKHSESPAIKAEDILVEQPIEAVVVEDVVVGETETGVGREMTVLEEKTVRVDLTESIENILTEQREQTAKVLESVLKANTKIANNVAKHVKSAAGTNEILAEAIIGLTEKIGLLEAKLDAIENLEIPTPIVQLQAPQKVLKEVHRDKKGLVSHITETPVDEDE
jgi:predicted nucleic acid-binding protein